MNLVTEVEARKKFCPFVLGACRGSDCFLLRQSPKRDERTNEPLVYCGVGSDQGAWVARAPASRGQETGEKEAQAAHRERNIADHHAARVPAGMTAKEASAAAGIPIGKVRQAVLTGLIKAATPAPAPDTQWPPTNKGVI